MTFFSSSIPSKEHVTLFTTLSFCLHKNVKREELFDLGIILDILRRLDLRRYGISSAPAEIQSGTVDFLVLLCVAAEFSVGLFTSTSLPGLLASNLRALL